MVADVSFAHHSHSKKEADVEMDVPKITVFKSPPWQKPVVPIVTPRISDVYEEFPTKVKAFSRRLNFGGSRSLECIPENMILQETQKYSTQHLRDSNRLSPHQVLPPIVRECDDELPEMRQRAYSDPHRYSTGSKKKVEERRESPLSKSIHTTHPSPPKDKPHLHKTGTTPNGCHKVLRRISGKDGDDRKLLNSPGGNIPGMPISQGTHEQLRAKHGTPLTAKPPLHLHEHKSHLKKKQVDSSAPKSNPATPERRVNRNRQLVSKSMSSDTIVPNPSAALKETRVRTNSLPATLNRREKTSSTNMLPISMPKEVKSSVAYALIGSPGRNRWPSPDREATSYINSDGESPADNTDSDSQEAIHKLQPVAASDEFNSILHDFKIHDKVQQLNSITDPKEYFQKVANWRAA